MQSNDFTKFILRSPLHGLLSGSMLLITVTGRKTGRIVTLPVQYLRDGNQLWITSTRERIWWHNLRGGAKVTMLLRGKDVKGQGEVIEDEQAVVDSFRNFFQLAPRSARYFNIRLDPQGEPEIEDIARLSRERVMVKVLL